MPWRVFYVDVREGKERKGFPLEIPSSTRSEEKGNFLCPHF